MHFLYLNAMTIGRGDEELGQKLLVSFLINLAESSVSVDLIGCVNSAIELTTSEGQALDALRALEAKGAKIASCGTCLDHFEKRDELKIGGVGNMSQTIEIMASAVRVTSPC